MDEKCISFSSTWQMTLNFFRKKKSRATSIDHFHRISHNPVIIRQPSELKCLSREKEKSKSKMKTEISAAAQKTLSIVHFDWFLISSNENTIFHCNIPAAIYSAPLIDYQCDWGCYCFFRRAQHNKRERKTGGKTHNKKRKNPKVSGGTRAHLWWLIW